MTNIRSGVKRQRRRLRGACINGGFLGIGLCVVAAIVRDNGVRFAFVLPMLIAGFTLMLTAFVAMATAPTDPPGTKDGV